MFDVLTIAYRVIALIGGSLFLYAAIFLYGDEQGRIQNTLEDLWVKIDDRQRVALSRHTKFMQVLARFMTVGLDRMFGKKLFSVKSIGVSTCYSFASFYILVLAYNLFFPLSRNSPPTPIKFLLEIAALPLGIYLFLGLLPFFICKPVALKAWFVVVILFGFFTPALEVLMAQLSSPSSSRVIDSLLQMS